MYVVPRYTEISHFRAPYKDSLLGLGALFSTSAATVSPTSTTRPTYTTTTSGGSPDAAQIGADFQAGTAKYWEAKQYDMDGRAAAFVKTLNADALAKYRAANGIMPWQSLPANWDIAILQYQYDIAKDPNTTWRKNLRAEAKKAFGYGQILNQPIGEGFLGKVALGVTDRMFKNTKDPGQLDLINELVWRLSVEEANLAKQELTQQTAASGRSSQPSFPRTVTGDGGAAEQGPPGGGGQAQPPQACPAGQYWDGKMCVTMIHDGDQVPPMTAGLAKALPWAAAAAVAGGVIWYAVKKKG